MGIFGKTILIKVIAYDEHHTRIYSCCHFNEVYGDFDKLIDILWLRDLNTQLYLVRNKKIYLSLNCYFLRVSLNELSKLHYGLSVLGQTPVS